MHALKKGKKNMIRVINEVISNSISIVCIGLTLLNYWFDSILGLHANPDLLVIC